VPLEPKQGLKAVDIINQLGYAISSFVVEAMSLINFFGMITIALLQIAVFRRRVHWTPLFYHMEQIGLNAILVIGLLSFLIGVVLAFQGVDQLRRFGAELLIVNLLGVSILRELGILMTAIVVAGRSGSAFTAQIGTMQVNQEIDAMRTLGLDPVDRLVTPRILALVLTLPLLTFYADIVSLVGGATMCYFKLGISLSQFVFQLHSAVTAEQLMVGIIKAPVFALTIAIVGCYEGFQVSGNTESVGKLTTKAVVESIFLVVLFDALFSILFSALGI
jgi:phospholipid/cholesterol/gamma-HCH transport system permease protein